MELVPIFRENGVGWGGEKDGRHFEYIRPDTSIAEAPAKD
jgi:hypothetical protein